MCVCVKSVCARGAQLSLGHVHSEQAAESTGGRRGEKGSSHRVEEMEKEG